MSRASRFGLLGSGTSLEGRLGFALLISFFLSFCLAAWAQRPTPNAPLVRQATPELVGIGGKVRLAGVNLGTAQNAVVVFYPGVIAEREEMHTPSEIIARVPVGAQNGPVRVVTGVDAPSLRALQIQMGLLEGVESPGPQADLRILQRAQQSLVAKGRASNSVSVRVTCAFLLHTKPLDSYVQDLGGFKFLRHRLIVDLKDFLSFDSALQIADRLNADLVGYFPITNSYVLDLRRPPASLAGLEAIIARVQTDARVAEVWKDMLMDLKQAVFVDADVVDRYRHNYNANLFGREDVWATDRIQAPGAWNLIERFIGRANLNHVKMAVMDTGCDQTHPEFAGVDLKKVVTVWIHVRIAGREIVLPGVGKFQEQAYDLGDAAASQHGTRVVSLIGSRNGNVLDAGEGDRGINGLLHNPMPYTIQVYRGGDLHETGDWTSVTEFLSAINTAAITGAKILSASWGQPYPINPDTSARRQEVRVALRKLAHQLNQFQNRLLLVVAAGNEAEPGEDPENMQGLITPFEDLNLNGALDAGEDFNGNGTLDNGNYVGASLGTLPNVITLGATGGPDHNAGAGRDWARDDQRAEFSNWGVPVQLAAPGADVFTAGGPAGTFTIGGARFRRSAGTSFSTPLTSGSAALLRAINPALTPTQVKNYLINTSFQVNTTDQTGALLVWQTLKTGFAVRQVMVDQGIIGNDQAWTGVSKIVTNGLNLFEIRRGPAGRAEGFADRALPVDGFLPTIRHDGRWVAYYDTSADGSNAYVRAYEFETGLEVQLAGPYHYLNFFLGQPLEYNPKGDLMWALNFVDDCARQNQVWVLRAADLINVLIADTGLYNTCNFDDDGNPLDWQFYLLMGGRGWRPDNRQWDLDYVHQAGFGSDPPTDNCRAWWRDQIYPQATLPFPGCTGEEFWLPCWSPDGRARAGALMVTEEDRLITRYYDDARNQMRERNRFEPGSRRPWINWSPDGSEVAYSYVIIGNSAYLVSVRRDIRTLDDRVPVLIYSPVNASCPSWQW